MPLDCKRSWNDSDLDLYRDTACRFIDEEMAPQDKAARERGHVGHEIWRRAGELGLLCADMPEEFGGGGGDFRHEAVFCEEMARRALSGMNTSVHSIVAHYLLNHGTDEQKRAYLPRMATGELIGAIAMTEPGAGSDLQGIRTRAEKQGDGYVLSGSKTFITNGFLAGLVLVDSTHPEQLKGAGAKDNWPTWLKLMFDVSLSSAASKELEALAALAKDNAMQVRLIEMMPIGYGAAMPCISGPELRARFARRWPELAPLSPAQEHALGDGPAVYYTVPGWQGSIGFIAAVHGKFCASCNRVRLTSQGFLRPCLASETGCDLRALLRSGADDAQLLAAIRETIWAKPREHHFNDRSMPATRGMYRIGG